MTNIISYCFLWFVLTRVGSYLSYYLACKLAEDDPSEEGRKAHGEFTLLIKTIRSNFFKVNMFSMGKSEGQNFFGFFEIATMGVIAFSYFYSFSVFLILFLWAMLIIAFIDWTTALIPDSMLFVAVFSLTIFSSIHLGYSSHENVMTFFFIVFFTIVLCLNVVPEGDLKLFFVFFVGGGWMFGVSVIIASCIIRFLHSYKERGAIPYGPYAFASLPIVLLMNKGLDFLG